MRSLDSASRTFAGSPSRPRRRTCSSPADEVATTRATLVDRADACAARTACTTRPPRRSSPRRSVQDVAHAAPNVDLPDDDVTRVARAAAQLARGPGCRRRTRRRRRAAVPRTRLAPSRLPAPNSLPRSRNLRHCSSWSRSHASTISVVTHAERLLLGPGPSNPYPEVMEAFQRPVLGHLDPEFLVVLDEIADRLRAVFRTDERADAADQRHRLGGHGGVLRQPASSPATPRSSASTACSASACARSRAACGAEVVRVDEPWGRAIDPQRLLDAHAAAPARAPARGRARRDVDRRRERRSRRSRRCSDTDTLLLVDTVTSLGGIPVEVDAWGIDAVYSGTQKCLGVPPGLSPVSFSTRAVERVAGRAHAAAVVVPRPRPHRRLRRQRAPLPPHRADLDALRAARRPRRRARRRTRRVVGAAPRRSARCSRTRCPSSASGCSRRTAGSRSSRRCGCPTASTTPRCAASCSPATASRSAAGSASSRARAGASG